MAGGGGIDLQADLERDLTDRIEYADGMARRFERFVSVCWWGAIIFAALASVLGFVAATPQVSSHLKIDPWIVSSLAAISSAFVIMRRKTSWRAKSDLFYENRDLTRQLLARMRHQMPHPLSLADRSAISRDYENVLADFGQKMRRLNNLIDEQSSAEHAKRNH